MINKTKEIRPTRVWFETEKEFVEFINDIQRSEKYSETAIKMRELMKKHRESK